MGAFQIERFQSASRLEVQAVTFPTTTPGDLAKETDKLSVCLITFLQNKQSDRWKVASETCRMLSMGSTQLVQLGRTERISGEYRAGRTVRPVSPGSSQNES